MGSTADRQVISYLTLRRRIGILGVLYPVWLSAWCRATGDCAGIEGSISAYYHTAAHDWFVGILFAIAIFLWAYKGPEAKDDLVANLACLFAVGVALCPTGHEQAWIHHAHTVCAFGLFLVLAWFCLVLFVKSGGDPTPRKLVRNRVYRICGWVMLGCIAAIALVHALGSRPWLDAWSPVFWLETLALWAFGFSWLVKGEMLWPDR